MLGWVVVRAGAWDKIRATETLGSLIAIRRSSS
jgi:hypothetical protein